MLNYWNFNDDMMNVFWTERGRSFIARYFIYEENSFIFINENALIIYVLPLPIRLLFLSI